MLREALTSLGAHAEELQQHGAQSFAFYHWALGITVPEEQFGAMAHGLSDELASGARSVHSLAALGFLLGVDPMLSGPFHDVFRNGVAWLLGRTGGSQTSLAALMHPVAQTGVLVGLLELGDQLLLTRFGAWFGPLSQRLQAAIPPEEGWRLDLIRMIEKRQGAGVDEKRPLVVDSAAAAIYVARDMAQADDAGNGEFAARLLGRIKSAQYRDAEEAVLDLAAYRYLASGGDDVNLRAPSTGDVALVLQRLSSGLRRWTWEDSKKTPNSTAQKWAVEHEYHFQNLLYAILAPVFPDIRDEEWLASVGHKKPRADLVLPALRLVVEVKYWRAKHPPQTLISQIAEDVSLYLKLGSPYTKVLPVIWDEGRRTEQYDYLVSGLLEIRDVVSPTVVPQPAFMVLANTDDA
jgi:hypothetical protein